MITTKHVIVRYTNMTTFESCNVLQKRYYLFGLKVFSKHIDCETIPIWASIQMATIGSTEWKSRMWGQIKLQD